MGAWIEIIRKRFISVVITVAPLVGAWIEIDVYDKKTDKY